jgi:hypothetical protein
MRVLPCRWRGVLTGIGVLLWATLTHADAKLADDKTIHADFLEYLGSVEAKENHWMDIADKSVAKDQRIDQDDSAKAAAQRPKQPGGEDKP